MDFEPSDDQRLLVDSVDAAAGATPTASSSAAGATWREPEGYSPALWAQFAELGLLGLPFAEEYGGFGGGAQEVMLVMQAFGRALVLEPYLPTVVLGGTALHAGRQSAAQKQAMLPAIAEGSLKLAFAHGERQARYDLTDVVTTAKRSGGGWVLDGSQDASFRTARRADKLVVSARTGGRSRTMRTGSRCSWSMPARPGWRGAAMRSRDDTRAADISLSNVAVSGRRCAGRDRRRVAGDPAGDRGGDRRDRRRDGRRDGSDERNDAGIPQDAGRSSASRSATYQVVQHRSGGHVHGAGAGAQHGDAGDDVDRQPGRGRARAQISRWRRWALVRRGGMCRRARCRCMAASA